MDISTVPDNIEMSDTEMRLEDISDGTVIDLTEDRESLDYITGVFSTVIDKKELLDKEISLRKYDIEDAKKCLEMQIKELEMIEKIQVNNSRLEILMCNTISTEKVTGSEIKEIHAIISIINDIEVILDTNYEYVKEFTKRVESFGKTLTKTQQEIVEAIDKLKCENKNDTN